jgi:hypothetical protein
MIIPCLMIMNSLFLLNISFMGSFVTQNVRSVSYYCSPHTLISIMDLDV